MNKIQEPQLKIQKVTNNIKAQNIDLEKLKTHFPHYFDKNGNFDFEKFKNYLTEKEINFSTESYGLEWLGKSYARLLASDPATTLLKADKTHNAKPENTNSENLLIKGDNLEVLKHLANAYYEKIKMIYIDPPYNTGSDGFVYNDDRKYTVKDLQNLIGIDEEKAQRILEFTQSKSKSNSHSAWLTFMYPRLYIAKQLLREDGVIFVSIDDNEVAQLRLLMDEIFGEENFITQLIWRKRAGGGSDSKYISIEHEYCVLYAKSIDKTKFNRLELDDKTLRNYPYEDDYVNTKGRYCLKPLHNNGLQDSLGLHYDIKCPDGTILKGSEHQWVYSESTFNEKLQNGYIEFKKNEKGWKVYYKVYLNEEKGKLVYDQEGNIVQRKRKPFSILYDIAFNKDGNADLTAISMDKKFDYPKPVNLIKHLLKLGTDKDDLILDFFAGSGTTGEAVMQLNAEDGGNRKFILVQLPEPIDQEKNKTAYDFVKDELKAEPTIFEITKERLIRAAKKIKTETIDTKIKEKEKELQELQNQLNLSLKDKEEKIKKLQNEIDGLKNQDLGFKIFETMPIWDDYNFEAQEFDSSQTLFDTEKLTKDDLKALLITWKTYDGIPLTQDLENVDLDGYTAYYGKGKLYLMHKGFTTEHLRTLLEKIDNEENFEPKIIIAFGYHFESARLRELSENVKSYTNKKHIDIDFIIRY